MIICFELEDCVKSVSQYQVESHPRIVPGHTRVKGKMDMKEAIDFFSVDIC